MADAPDEVSRLMAALAAHREWEEQSDGDAAAFLARHEALRDLLEPMLAGGGDGGDAGDTAAAEPVERTLGRYRMRHELGRGGMGAVFLAWHPDLRREVAVKVLPPQQSLNPRAVARFQREASAMARLEHPGIVSVFEVGRDQGQHFFAMELLRGKTLELLLQERRAVGAADESWRRQVVGWGIQLCDALSFAHSRGVLHRDLKPANVMVEPDDRVVLTDFGLARIEALGGPGLTADGQFAGTPYYCSPEQAAGRWHEVGAPADVFALGVTLYELLALERPFEGDTAHEVLHAIAQQEPKPLLRVAPGISRDLAAVVHMAITKDPLQRHASAAALGADLRAALDRRPVTARHATVGQRLVRWARREPLQAVLVAVLAMGVPALTGLIGYVQASADEVAAGERALRERAIEESLDRGYALLAEGRLGEAYGVFGELVEAEGALPEALAGELLVLGELLDPAPLAAWVENWSAALASNTVLRRVADSLRFRDRSVHDWLGDRADWTATDCFVAASYCATRGRLDRTGGLAAEAVYLFEQACLAAPRLHHLCGLARAAADLGDDLAVTEAVEALERSFPDRLPALLTLSEVLRDRLPGRALAIAERALAAAPGQVDLQVNLATLQLAAGEVEMAEARLRDLLQQHPDHRGALGAAAAAARRRGDLPAARDLLVRALAAAPAIVPGAGPDWGERADLAAAVIHGAPQPDLALDLVEILVELDQLDQAMVLLGRARGLLPAFDEPRAGIAQALLHAGRRDEAREVLAPAIAEDTEDPLPWLVWAKVCNEFKEYETARVAAVHALELDDGDPRAHYVHASVLFNLGRLDDAAAALAPAIALDPASEGLSKVLVQVRTAQRDVRSVILEVERLAAALYASGDPTRAAAVLEPYLKMPPPAILPDAEAIGARVQAAWRSYRTAAGR